MRNAWRFFMSLPSIPLPLLSERQGMEILKTYKLYIDGKFPRTESGRYAVWQSPKKKWIANYCKASRKDLKAAVTAAHKAFGAWSNRSGFNRGQILYRIAEMLEGRKQQFIDELILQGCSLPMAKREVRESIARCVYYAGWCDKYQVISNTVNPVNTPHFNFSVAEPMGVIGLIAPKNYGLLGLISTMLPIIAGGNTLVILAAEEAPLSSITLAEVLATYDVPNGVVNILTGQHEELIPVMASHYEIAAVILARQDAATLQNIQRLGAQQIKRVMAWEHDWLKADSAHPYWIIDTLEIKTTWHPIRRGFQGGSSY